ncbi:hypothetical protein [Anaerobiospirillum sp. NML120449]|uniref:hypothetical protein n=1 Tax=Anaerobiospirillum sp. NML120449 TaxID=2932817 RepID=UPI001FF49DAC|nr:hypothetical protein [Anaerobiospirillum sp. NML120449]MCK0526402.1 hypothetical protein [Anaerobiospirillum sp. NML120449]
MLQNHFKKAAQDLINELNRSGQSQGSISEISLNSAVMCDQRLFYLFKVIYPAASEPQMAIAGDYKSFDPEGQGTVMTGLGNFDEAVGYTVIKGFVQNRPFNAAELVCDEQYRFDKVEHPYQEISASIEDLDSNALAAFMQSRTIMGYVLLSENSFDVNAALESYKNTWGVDLCTLEGYEVTSGDNGNVAITYQDCVIDIALMPEPVDSALLQASAALNRDWPEAADVCSSTTGALVVTVCCHSGKLAMACTMVRWLAVLASMEHGAAVLYNGCLFEPGWYAQSAAVMKENEGAIPVNNLVWVHFEELPDGNLSALTMGLAASGHLEFAIESFKGNHKAASDILLRLAGFVLANNAALPDGVTVEFPPVCNATLHITHSSMLDSRVYSLELFACQPDGEQSAQSADVQAQDQDRAAADAPAEGSEG